MKLSVAHTFEPGIISRLSAFPSVYEVYGKLRSDPIGGGRSSYTLRSNSWNTVREAVKEAHAHGIEYNYLINAATLNGLEQTRAGQKTIRKLLDTIALCGVDAVTVSLPYLLRLVKTHYPQLKVRVGVFALIDNVRKAIEWEDMGADTLCLSSIALNRDFDTLAALKEATSCALQLIVNASCLPGCTHELTHMNMLSTSSQSSSKLKGYCLDYCVMHCSQKRLTYPINYIRSIWIRPEDLHMYEELGYTNFKIVERSCPGDLLISRVAAYEKRSFEGNLLALVAPVAQIKKEQKTPLWQRLRMIATMAKPWHIKLSSLLAMKKYGEAIIMHDYTKENALVYIENKDLDGFLKGLKDIRCTTLNCKRCSYCQEWAQKTVHYNAPERERILKMGNALDEGLLQGSLW